MREPQTKEYKRKQYLKHRKHIIEHTKEYYYKNKETALARMKLYGMKHIGEKREYNKHYRGVHWKELSEYNKVYRLIHKEKLLEIAAGNRRKFPWKKAYSSAIQRCKNRSNTGFQRYGGRGIKFKMTMTEFKLIWFRDKAYLMKQPSIDRINNNGDYTLSNCRYIELSENRIKGDKL